MLTVRRMAARAINNRHEAKSAQNETTVYMYGDIGGWFGIDSAEWVQDFNKIDADVIHLRVDSSGGDVFSARAMKTAIMQHKAKVIAHVDGLAASAASFFIMGADEIEIVDGGFIMIHNAMSFLDVFGYFNADALQELIDDIGKERDLHAKINDAIANDYVKRTGNSIENVKAWMADETWFTAKESMDNKFVDRIYDGQPVDGSYDLSTFAKTPDAVTERNLNLSKRTLEKALRDAGLSNKEAKKILAEGFRDDHRDVETPEIQMPVEEVQRDVDSPKPKKDTVNELLIRVARAVS